MFDMTWVVGVIGTVCGTIGGATGKALFDWLSKKDALQAGLKANTENNLWKQLGALENRCKRLEELVEKLNDEREKWMDAARVCDLYSSMLEDYIIHTASITKPNFTDMRADARKHIDGILNEQLHKG